MQIKNVILATDTNPTYFQFWNPISKIWKTKFNINPVLVFLGTEQDRQRCELTEEYGTIFIQPPVPGIPTAWSATWSLFYYTQFFPDDVCLIMGIDQIPLSTMFIKDKIEKLDENSYVMYIADAYDGPGDIWKQTPHNREIGRFPTAYHAAKGKLFKEIYNFESTFAEEINKLNSIDSLPYSTSSSLPVKWGIDESYASLKLREYYQKTPNNKIVSLNLISELSKKRIDRSNLNGVFSDDTKKKLQEGYYVEAHMPRPLNQNLHLLQFLIDNIK